jgi:hypothetical protein
VTFLLLDWAELNCPTHRIPTRANASDFMRSFYLFQATTSNCRWKLMGSAGTTPYCYRHGSEAIAAKMCQTVFPELTLPRSPVRGSYAAISVAQDTTGKTDRPEVPSMARYENRCSCAVDLSTFLHAQGTSYPA